MKKDNKVIAVLTAAGIGSRTKQDIPKQFIHINNKPLIVYTMEAFEIHPYIDSILVVCLDGWHEVLKAYAKQFNITKLKWVVNGGKTGQESIKCGLLELKKHCSEDDIIMIHDGNRALVSQEIITDSIVKYKKYGSAIAAIPCVEAIFISEDGTTSENQVPREKLFRTQTPHTYSLKKLIKAHEEADKKGIVNTTATCTLMQILGEKIHFSMGSEKNLKVTTIDDIEMFQALINTNLSSNIKR